jgi:hypothetical protein
MEGYTPLKSAGFCGLLYLKNCCDFNMILISAVYADLIPLPTHEKMEGLFLIYIGSEKKTRKTQKPALGCPD